MAILWSTDTALRSNTNRRRRRDRNPALSYRQSSRRATAASSTPEPRRSAACRTGRSWAVQSSHTLPGAGRAGGLRRHRRPAAASAITPRRRPPDRRHPNRLRRRGDQARFAIAPTCRTPACVWYEEFSNLAAPLLRCSAPLTLTLAAHATRWADDLADGADVLARHRHRELVGSPRSRRGSTGRTHHRPRYLPVRPGRRADVLGGAEPIAAGWSIVGSPVRLVGPSRSTAGSGSCTTGRAATPRRSRQR